MPRFGSDSRRRYQHWWWLGPLLVVALNGALLSMYRVVYSVRFDQLGAQAQARGEALESLRRERRDLEALLEQAGADRAGIETPYEGRVATQSERPTRTLSAVQDLARLRGLPPGGPGDVGTRGKPPPPGCATSGAGTLTLF